MKILGRQDNIELAEGDGFAQIFINYPRGDGALSHLRIGLCDTRAADDIRIHFDFERDGWVIEQASLTEWLEAAFCPAWQYQGD